MTPRQFYIIIAIYTISIKVQKLPCVMYNALQKDSFVLMLLYFIINILGILFVFFVLKNTSNKTLKQEKNAKLRNFCKRIIMFFTMFYFILRGILLYEHVQDLFSNTLFDNLPWSLFCLLLLFAVFFLARGEIDNIALNYEIYMTVIVSAYVIIAILGASQTDFRAILPLETINISKTIANILPFNIWFGDFLLVFYVGRHVEKIKLSKTLLVYTLASLFCILLFVEFNGIYESYTPLQPGLISVLSEHSMLGINVGRVDWFLILLTEIGAILSCSLSIYFANACAKSAFPKLNPLFIELVIIAMFYVMDIFVFVDLKAKQTFFLGSASVFSLVLKIFTVLLLLCLALKQYIGKNKKPKFENSGDKLIADADKKPQKTSKKSQKSQKNNQKLKNTHNFNKNSTVSQDKKSEEIW